MFSRAFAADFAEEERERDRKEAEAKDIEHNKMFKDAFERIKQVLSIVYSVYSGASDPGGSGGVGPSLD